jgi:hypothetical protein
MKFTMRIVRLKAMGKFLKTDNRQTLEGIYEEYAGVSTRAVHY